MKPDPKTLERAVLHLRDADPVVRSYAETGLWALWSRSGDAKVDAFMVRGVDEMNGGRLAEAAASFSEAIRPMSSSLTTRSTYASRLPRYSGGRV